MRRSVVAALAALVVLAGLAWWLWPRSVERAAPVAAAVASPPSLPPPPPEPALARALESAPPDPRAAVSSTTSTTLFGFVRDAEGRPVSNATVRALPRRGAEARVARSGADGEYVLLGVPVALDAAEASATGYLADVRTSPVVTSPRARLDFTLPAAPGIRGIVRCNGEPASGARVYARLSSERRHGRGVAGTGQSGPDGRFLIELDLGGPPLTVFAWSGTCGEGSAPFEGEPVTLDLEGSATVSGQVIDARTKRPIPSFWISAASLLRNAGGPPAVSVEDERGAFVLGPIAPGPQRLYVAASGYQPASKEVGLTAGQTVEGVTIELSRSTELRGRVTDAVTGLPIEGASVAPAEWTAEVLSDAVGAITGPDGRYALTTLPDKRTSVTASARGYRSLMHGGVNGRSQRPITLDFALTPYDPSRGDRESNELVGIGAQLRMTDVGVEVAGLVPRAPAASKLRAGDVIVQVDDTQVKDLDLGDVVQAIRGEAGSEVVLWVQRMGEREPVRVSFERARVTFAPAN